MKARMACAGLFLFSACTGGPQPAELPTPSSAARAARPATRPADVLTSQELRNTQAGSLYDAIRRLRPQMLRRFAPSLSGQAVSPAVYLNRHFLGEVDVLHTIPASMPAEIRYLSVTEAQHGLGVYHAGGVIVITPSRAR